MPKDSAVSGRSLLKLAATRIGEEYILGSRADMDDPNFHGPWDCAEFVTWVVYQLTGKLYGVTEDDDPWTGAWMDDMLHHKVYRVPLSVAIKTPGAVLLRRSKKGGHIAFSTGDGGTIEAMGRKYGVRTGKAAGRFNYGILVPGVDY